MMRLAPAKNMGEFAARLCDHLMFWLPSRPSPSFPNSRVNWYHAKQIFRWQSVGCFVFGAVDDFFPSSEKNGPVVAKVRDQLRTSLPSRSSVDVQVAVRMEVKTISASRLMVDSAS